MTMGRMPPKEWTGVAMITDMTTHTITITRVGMTKAIATDKI